MHKNYKPCLKEESIFSGQGICWNPKDSRSWVQIPG